MIRTLLRDCEAGHFPCGQTAVRDALHLFFLFWLWCSHVCVCFFCLFTMLLLVVWPLRRCGALRAD